MRIHRSVKIDTRPSASEEAASQRTDEKSEGSANTADISSENNAAASNAREIGGPKGPEPTRYGDWERKGRCVDF